MDGGTEGVKDETDEWREGWKDGERRNERNGRRVDEVRIAEQVLWDWVAEVC